MPPKKLLPIRPTSARPRERMAPAPAQEQTHVADQELCPVGHDRRRLLIGEARRRVRGRILHVPQLAIRWGISERQVWRYIALSDLMATRFGRSVRISAAEVARFETSLTVVK